MGGMIELGREGGWGGRDDRAGEGGRLGREG